VTCSTRSTPRSTRRGVFWPVFRAALKDTFGLSVARERFLVKRERPWGAVFLGLLLGLVFAAFEALSFEVFRAVAAGGAGLGQPEVVIVFALLIAQAMVFMLGLFWIVSSFYLSRDLGLLVALPLSPATVVGVKYGTVLVRSYLVVVPLGAPALAAYAAVAGGGLLYWLSAVVVLALAPVIPLALVSVLALGLARLINRRRRDLLLNIMLALGVGSLVLAQLWMVSNLSDRDLADLLQGVLAGQTRLIGLIGRSFPPLVWSADFISAAEPVVRLGSLAALLGSCGAALWVMGFIGERVFYGGVTGGRGVARHVSGAGRAGGGAVDRALAGLREGSALGAVVRREWRLFMREPGYAVGGFLGSIVIPAVFLVPALGASNPEIARLLEPIRNGGSEYYVALGFAAVVALLAGISATSCTSVSREGRRLWISKVIPAGPERLVLGKLIFSTVFAAIGALPPAAVYVFLASPPVGVLVGALLLGLLGSVPVSLMGLLVDATRPHLSWSDPQQAVSGNLNVFLALAANALYLAAAAFLVRWLHGRVGLGESATSAVLVALIVIITILLYRLTLAAAAGLYERRDV